MTTRSCGRRLTNLVSGPVMLATSYQQGHTFAKGIRVPFGIGREARVGDPCVDPTVGNVSALRGEPAGEFGRPQGVSQ